jgi:hypothetical protein
VKVCTALLFYFIFNNNNSNIYYIYIFIIDDFSEFKTLYNHDNDVDDEFKIENKNKRNYKNIDEQEGKLLIFFV